MVKIRSREKLYYKGGFIIRLFIIRVGILYLRPGDVTSGKREFPDAISISNRES